MNVSLIVGGCGLLMFGVERVRPGRAFPRVAGWLPRALLFNCAQAMIIFASGFFVSGWASRHRLWSADRLGLIGGALVGYLACTFVFYWWHRWRHEVPQLWRWLHQLHHSPQRLEVLASFYKHPLELLLDSLIGGVTLFLVVGLSPAPATLPALLCGVASLFYHWNICTPRWLGYVIQRPESHCVHHESGVHNYNYSDLPLWDILFGTFRNPCEWDAQCGFEGGRERQILAMLVGREVSES